jgi:hypothetical protein
MDEYDIYSQKNHELQRVSDSERRGMLEYGKTVWEATTEDV